MQNVRLSLPICRQDHSTGTPCPDTRPAVDENSLQSILTWPRWCVTKRWPHWPSLDSTPSLITWSWPTTEEQVSSMPFILYLQTIPETTQNLRLSVLFKTMECSSSGDGGRRDSSFWRRSQGGIRRVSVPLPLWQHEFKGVWAYPEWQNVSNGGKSFSKQFWIEKLRIVGNFLPNTSVLKKYNLTCLFVIAPLACLALQVHFVLYSTRFSSFSDASLDPTGLITLAFFVEVPSRFPAHQRTNIHSYSVIEVTQNNLQLWAPIERTHARLARVRYFCSECEHVCQFTDDSRCFRLSMKRTELWGLWYPDLMGWSTKVRWSLGFFFSQPFCFDCLCTSTSTRLTLHLGSIGDKIRTSVSIPDIPSLLSYAGKSRNMEPFPLNSFLPKSRNEYFRYRGSVTTPPCPQTVTWNLFKNTIKISQKQVWTWAMFLQKLLNKETVLKQDLQMCLASFCSWMPSGSCARTKKQNSWRRTNCTTTSAPHSLSTTAKSSATSMPGLLQRLVQKQLRNFPHYSSQFLWRRLFVPHS